MSRQTTQEKKLRIKRKIRASISGTETRPRMSVFRSSSHIYVQLIDDVRGITIASASDAKSKKGTNMQSAETIGKEIAAAAKAKGVEAVVFDRNGFKYTGRIKVLADAARAAGLTF